LEKSTERCWSLEDEPVGNPDRFIEETRLIEGK